MNIFIPKHQLNPNLIKATLIVLAIISNVHFTKSISTNELLENEFELIKEGAIQVFKFKNAVENIAQADDRLFVAGLNYIYLIKDEFYKSTNFFKKAFFSQPKNQHLSLTEFKKPSLQLEHYLPTNKFPLNCNSSTSPDCKSPDQPIENLNKILVKTSNNPTFFIICGTAYNGQCFLSFIADNKLQLKNVIADKRFDLIGSKKSSLLITIPKDAKFIHAFEPDGRNSSLRPPLVSKLKFNKGQLDGKTIFSFEPIVHGPQKTVVNIHDNELLKKFQFNFIYGFIYENFAFVLKRELREGHLLETRLARVCLDDSSFFSYTEIPLSCKEDEKSTDEFTYANSAHFGQADTYLTKKTDIKLMNKTLFITFNNYDNKAKKMNKSKGSVLCAFTIEKLNEFYSHAINNCYEGGLNSETVGLMTQYSLVKKQTNTCQQVNKGEDYLCYGNNINSYVEYRDKLRGYHLYTFKQDIITSLATSGLNLKEKGEVLNIFALGSEEGKLYKVIRTYDDELVLTHSFKINSHSSVDQINSNPLISETSKNVYFTTGRHMIKYPLNSCSIYSNCNQCLKALDNLKCGWCSIENQNSGGCLNREECSTLGKDETFKTSFSLNMCPPIIENFTPKKGPLEGNTVIEIKGENLCNPQRDQKNQIPNYKVNVTIGKHWCELESCTEESLKCKTTKMTSISSDPLKVCTVDHGNLGYEIDGCSFSLLKFNYTKTEVFKLEPRYGPIGGGTKVTLVGNNLNSGTRRVVKIKESYCEEMTVNNSHLVCLTKGIQIDNENEEILKRINQDGRIILEIDDNKYEIDDAKNKPDVTFEFKPNPTVLKYSPKAGLRNSSINISITGKYFTSAHNLQLKTSMDTLEKGKIFLLSKCLMINNSTLNCTLPKVPDEIKIKSSQSPLEAEISLIPDGDLNKSKIQSNVINFFYYPLPSFFTESPDNYQEVSINSLKKGLLEIKGRNLSDQYPFKIKAIKLENEFINETNFENANLTDKFIYCNDKRVIDFKKIKCQIDFSSESIGNDLLKSIWIVQIEIEEQEPIKVQLIKFKLSDLASSRTSIIVSILTILIVCLTLMAGYHLYRTKRLEFSKEKKFPHFSVAYNSSPSMNNEHTMLDSTFMRQSSQNGIQTKSRLLEKQQLKENYKIRLAEDNILIPESCLEIIEKIGNGFFGCVYRGELNLPTKDKLEVAVKTLKNTSNENSEAFQNLIDEAFRMKDFKHENVLTLIGVCLKSEDSLPMIILPFMANGDLLTYIRCEDNSPTVKDLLYYGIDVGRGMSYLSSLKYVHRDLAARNCMMDERFRIKVADFGLTRDVYERNYYTSQHRSEIPIKWMAPESLEKYLTTTESDVWSYGILLWELLTRGNIPYPGFEGYQVLELIKSGKRMQKPDTCPIEIFELMLDCWQVNPKLRPSFDKIVERIERLIRTKESEVESVYCNLSVIYDNYPTEQYYSNNSKKLEKVERVSISTPSSPYYNSLLSIGPKSPKATINPINTSMNNLGSTNALSSQPSATINRMSTFKSPSSKTIEMPSNKQITLNNLNNNENIYNNDEMIKLCDRKTLTKEPSINEDETPLQISRKNSSNSVSTHSNLSFKLPRQNAIDEADFRERSNYEYVTQAPQISIDRKELSKELNEDKEEEFDNKNLDMNNFEKTDNYVNPIKYFK